MDCQTSMLQLHTAKQHRRLLRLHAELCEYKNGSVQNARYTVEFQHETAMIIIVSHHVFFQQNSYFNVLLT